MTMAADGEAIWKKIDEIKAANPGNRCTKYLSKVRAPRRTTRGPSKPRPATASPASRASSRASSRTASSGRSATGSSGARPRANHHVLTGA